MVVVCALYRMKSSGNSWILHLANVNDKKLGFKQFYADNDVWIKASTRKYRSHVYFYLCVYSDEILVIADNLELTMNKFNDYFSIKKDTIGKPTTHLGTNTRQRKDSQETFEFWNLGSKSYL